MSISVKDLISVLQGMEKGKGKKGSKQRKRRAAPTPGTQGSSQAQAMRPASGKRKKRRGCGSGSLEQGEVVIARSELLSTLTTEASGAVGGSTVLFPKSFPWLANIAKAFERVRWQSVRIEYRPAVGATADGTVAIGFDWGSTSVKQEADGGWSLVRAIDKASVLACTPCVDGPIWQRQNLSIPSQRLQSRAWYEITDSDQTSSLFDYAPGSIAYYAQGDKSKTVGEIWVHYRAQFSGTRKV